MTTAELEKQIAQIQSEMEEHEKKAKSFKNDVLKIAWEIILETDAATIDSLVAQMRAKGAESDQYATEVRDPFTKQANEKLKSLKARKHALYLAEQVQQSESIPEPIPTVNKAEKPEILIDTQSRSLLDTYEALKQAFRHMEMELRRLKQQIYGMDEYKEIQEANKIRPVSETRLEAIANTQLRSNGGIVRIESGDGK